MTVPPASNDPPQLRALSTAIEPELLSLVGPARDGTLLVYAGAGISIDSGLPTGATLSYELHRRIALLSIDLDGADEWDLLAVSDAVAAQPNGTAILQSEASRAFAFATAPPSPPHRALALLLLEGAIQMLTTNWDTCIERAVTAPDRIVSVVTSNERGQTQVHSLLKLHGCAYRVDTLLATSAQLAEPPLWAATEIAAGLTRDTVVFLGIGDVAPYVRHGIDAVVGELHNVSRIRVIFPNIHEEWSTSKWATVVPDFPESNKWDMRADQFAYGLLTGWVNSALADAQGAATSLGLADLPEAFAAVLTALRNHTADRVVSWLRRSFQGVRTGQSAMHSTNAREAFLAFALATRQAGSHQIPSVGPARAGTAVYELLISDDAPSGVSLAETAKRRAASYRQDGHIGPADKLNVICSGHMGPLQGLDISLPIDLVGGMEGDIISGSAVVLFDSHSVLNASAA